MKQLLTIAFVIFAGMAIVLVYANYVTRDIDKPVTNLTPDDCDKKCEKVKYYLNLFNSN